MSLDVSHVIDAHIVPLGAGFTTYAEVNELVPDAAEVEAAAHVRDRHVTHNDHADPFGA